MDPDPDPSIFIIDFQDANKKLIKKKNSAYYFLKVLLHGTVTHLRLLTMFSLAIAGSLSLLGLRLLAAGPGRLSGPSTHGGRLGLSSGMAHYSLTNSAPRLRISRRFSPRNSGHCVSCGPRRRFRRSFVLVTGGFTRPSRISSSSSDQRTMLQKDSQLLC
jgi:hypothetical protein